MREGLEAVVGCLSSIVCNSHCSKALRVMGVSSLIGGGVGLLTGLIGSGLLYKAGLDLGDLNGLDDDGTMSIPSEAYGVYILFCTGVGLVAGPVLVATGVGLARTATFFGSKCQSEEPEQAASWTSINP